MEYCRSQSTRYTQMFILGDLFLVLAVLAWIVLDDPDSVMIFAFFFCFICTLVFSLYFLWHHRKYALSLDGISVAYIQKWTKLIPWSSISEVAVCEYYRRKMGWETVIRIAVGPEFEGPSHGKGEWTKESYSIKYQYRIIIIDYSEIKLEEFKAICPLSIRDYR